MFNLGSIYFKLGSYISKNAKDDKNKSKEAVNYFKNALYIFDRLKNTAYSAISSKELPYDLYPTHLKYCAQMCIIYGQLEIIEVARQLPKQEHLLQAKLYLGISETFKSVAHLAGVKPTSKSFKEDFREFLLNRVQYYRGLMYQKLRDNAQAKFDKEGTGYGDALVFQGKLVSKLVTVEKSLEKCKK